MTTDLVISVDQRQERLKKLIDKHQQNILKIRQSISGIKDDIKWVFEEMKTIFPDLFIEGNQYDIDLLEVQNTYSRLTGEKSVERNQQTLDNVESMFKEDETNKEDCKKLFREIAKKCHTDTGEGKEDLFIKAKKAYDNGDYGELLEIEKSLLENKPVDTPDLHKKFHSLELEYRRKRIEHMDWTNKLFYKISLCHKSDKPSMKMTAKQLFANHMYQRMAETLEEKDELIEKIKNLEKS